MKIKHDSIDRKVRIPFLLSMLVFAAGSGLFDRDCRRPHGQTIESILYQLEIAVSPRKPSRPACSPLRWKPTIRPPSSAISTRSGTRATLRICASTAKTRERHHSQRHRPRTANHPGNQSTKATARFQPPTFSTIQEGSGLSVEGQGDACSVSAGGVACRTRPPIRRHQG